MQRPTSVTVFGILNLVFAVLGLCGTTVAVGMLLMPQDAFPQNPNVPNPAFELMREDGAYSLFNKVQIGLGFVATVALAAAGVGLLQMKAWGRQLSIVWALYSIVMGLVGMAVNYVYVVTPMMEHAKTLPPGPEQTGVTIGAIGGVLVGSCFGLAYPVILLIFMLLPSMAAAFAARNDAGNLETDDVFHDSFDV